MASLRRLPKSPYWIACFTLPDGTRTNRSTKTTDRGEAQRIANKFEDAAKEAAQGCLIESQARKVISDIFAIGNKTILPCLTIKDFFESWIGRKRIEFGERTASRYSGSINQLLDFLGNKKALDISRLTNNEISDFRDEISKRSSPSTVNFSLKILRAALNQARRDGIVQTNEAERVTFLKVKGKLSLRPFTLKEISCLLSVANDEWQSMILTGLYTGLRLGDIAKLTWKDVDLQNALITVKTHKTGRRVEIPTAAPLLARLKKMSVYTSFNQPLFPRSYSQYDKCYCNGGLSREFYNILVAAGLAKPRSFKETGKGKRVQHQQNELSFHCLRHTATSLLKNAGVSDVIARDIIGHESIAVSDNYTHIDLSTKRRAIESMPDVFAAIQRNENDGKNLPNEGVS